MVDVGWLTKDPWESSDPQAAIINQQFLLGLLTFCALTLPLEGFRNDEHDQDRQLRFNGVPISGVRINEVINRWIQQYQSRKEPCAWYLFANSAAQSPQGKH